MGNSPHNTSRHTPPNTSHNKSHNPLKKLSATVAGICVLLVALYSYAPSMFQEYVDGFLADTPVATKTHHNNQGSASSANPSSANNSNVVPFSTRAPGSITTGYVTTVHDGDTIWISLEGSPRGKDTKVRFIGIDTSEINDPDTKKIGDASTKVLKSYIYKKTVYVELDKDPYDRYDRLLAYIWLTDPRECNYDLNQQVNYLMVKEGYAEWIKVKPNTKYLSEYQRAQEEARREGRGLWKQGDFTKRALGKAA